MTELWTPPIVLVLFTIGAGVAFIVSLIFAIVEHVREVRERRKPWQSNWRR